MLALPEELLVVVIPAQHPLAIQESIDLQLLANEPMVLFPRHMGPTLFDTIVEASRAIAVEPTIGQTASQIASIIDLVAVTMGFSIVPASMSRIAVSGLTKRSIARTAPVARILLTWRSGDGNRRLRNFLSTATV